MSDSLFRLSPPEDHIPEDEFLAEYGEVDPPEMEEPFLNDFSDDAEWLASAGMGTDEDYGPDIYNDWGGDF